MLMRQTIRAVRLERHAHTDRYAALVLSGGYEEAGDNGRFQVRAGDVVFHDQFEAHLNRFSKNGAIVLNLRLGRANKFCPGIATVADPDLVARIAERDRRAATELLLSIAETCAPSFSDWPDELATKLIRCPSLTLSKWGEENRLAPWTISRGFSQIFGISPESFRARVRSRHALRSIQDTSWPLAAIAAEIGFADQAHMTRTVKQLTGLTPQEWRRAANGFKTPRHIAV